MDQNSSYDNQAVEVMKRLLRRNSICVDVGCHVGTFMDDFLRLAPEGKHFAFEPLPDLCEGLRRKYEGVSNVTVIEAALSDHDGKSRFTHVVSNPGYSGLRERRYERPDESLQEIDVSLLRLDQVIPVDLCVDMIKIDVEGAELEVMRGGVQTLRRSQPCIIFEHGLGAADCYGTTPGDIYELLCGTLGYRIHLMARWLRNGEDSGLGRGEFEDEFYSGREYYFMAVR
ncbi:FkbM family methyltransferase [Acidovorax sp. SDU_ACID1]|uniref:FkbM family methyltransferase n=1 Tax=Acidovorax sp. SDU_ACID1 TaxID=3136632 RepID=UPI0038739064